MYHAAPSSWKSWKDLLLAGLSEDQAQWDWTSLGTLSRFEGKREISARVVAKAEGVWAGAPLIEAANSISSGVKIRARMKDGQKLAKGDTVCELEGQALELLALERPLLNIAGYVSGIASATRRLVDLVAQACPKRTPRVSSTRKTLPLYRDIALHGVLSGGGHCHRLNLAGGVLIKENHIAAAGSIPGAIEGVRAVAPHGLKIEIEVRNEKELGEALKAGAEAVLLDNFAPEEVRAALKLIESARHRPVVEVSGGLHEKSIASYAIEGVDILSVGALTHSVVALDLSLLAEGIQ